MAGSRSPRNWLAALAGAAAVWSMAARAAEGPVSGDAVIRGRFRDSEIVITTTSRLAGAIHSLTWNGQEFIDSHDHGRQLQSASSFDAGLKQPFWAECLNPTEAGSRADGAGPTSTSQLLSMRAEGAELETSSRMAFWLRPGQESSGRPALNTAILSDHRLSKRVRIGDGRRANVLQYSVTFTVPEGEHHTLGQFEALTGYMPAAFSKFWKFVPATGQLEPLDDGPGEQKFPVVLSTEDGRFAMGIYSAGDPRQGAVGPGYGRFRFPQQRVVKWNCVYRVRRAEGIPAGDYTFEMRVPLGTLEDVRGALRELSEGR